MFKRISSIILTVMMCIMVAGCGSKKDNGTVYESYGTANGTSISMGLYKLNMMYIHQQILSSGFTGDISKEKRGDETVAQYIERLADQNTKEMIAINNKFDAEKMSFTAEQEENIKAVAKEMYSVNEILFKDLNITEEDTLLYQTISEKLRQLFISLYAEGGKLEDSKEEKIKTFEDYFYGAYLIPYLLLDEEYKPLSEEKLKEVKEKSEADLEEIEDGKHITDVMYDILISELKEGEEKPKRYENNEYIMPIYKDGDPYFPPIVNDYLKEAEVNVPKIIEDEEIRYIVMKANYKDIPEKTKLISYNNILSIVKESDFQKIVDEEVKKITFKIDEKAKASFTAMNLQNAVKKIQEKMQAEYEQMIKDMIEQQNKENAGSSSVASSQSSESGSSSSETVSSQPSVNESLSKTESSKAE